MAWKSIRYILLAIGILEVVWETLYNKNYLLDLRENLSSSEAAVGNKTDPDADCPFRTSPIYRKVFVYPNPGDKHWEGDILSDYARHQQSNGTAAFTWPWIERDEYARSNCINHYDPTSEVSQFATELLVREIMTNPKSCLRTYDPEEATLFYVPYLPSTMMHAYTKKNRQQQKFTFTKYAKALQNIVDHKDYTGWEQHFGLTSTYWKRQNGTDHIFVFSEPFHGMYYRSLSKKQGNYHYIHSQKQLREPIIISVEQSATFVDMYPNCARKNIVMPYPITDGKSFNGKYDQQAQLHPINFTSLTVLPAERQISRAPSLSSDSNATSPRFLAQYYSAGVRGQCSYIRKALKSDYENCAASHQALIEMHELKNFSIGMRHATFCPAPAGDSPSAKRMFDALMAGCIPVVVSADYVWPLTNETTHRGILEPTHFAVRLDPREFEQPRLDPETCQPLNTSYPGMQNILESISPADVLKLRRGVAFAATTYSYYYPRPDLPDYPLREHVLPDGGAAHALVDMLAERASGKSWESCRNELREASKQDREDPLKFQCL